MIINPALIQSCEKVFVCGCEIFPHSLRKKEKENRSGTIFAATVVSFFSTNQPSRLDPPSLLFQFRFLIWNGSVPNPVWGIKMAVRNDKCFGGQILIDFASIRVIMKLTDSRFQNYYRPRGSAVVLFWVYPAPSHPYGGLILWFNSNFEWRQRYAAWDSTLW